MLVPDEIRKCVAFLQYEAADGLRLAGTVFFVGIPIPELGDTYYPFAITAKHVIEAIRKGTIDDKVYYRLNFKDSSIKTISTDLSDWRFHPSESSVDVAAVKLRIPQEQVDHIIYPTSYFLTDEIIAKEKIGIGEELFLVGLFYGHVGAKRNTPIVRVGNIAAMPEEPVHTEDLGPIEAYLVEARSIGGLSGSPVFVHLGVVRPDDQGKPRFTKSIYGINYLLGLMHGHWDRPVAEQDTMVADNVRNETVNMGIGVVVPAKKILEVIHQPYFETMMRETIEKLRMAQSPKPPQ